MPTVVYRAGHRPHRATYDTVVNARQFAARVGGVVLDTGAG